MILDSGLCVLEDLIELIKVGVCCRCSKQETALPAEAYQGRYD